MRSELRLQMAIVIVGGYATVIEPAFPDMARRNIRIRYSDTHDDA